MLEGGVPGFVRAVAFQVTEFTVWQVLLIALVCGLGVGLITWLLAGYYERRGGFGKK